VPLPSGTTKLLKIVLLQAAALKTPAIRRHLTVLPKNFPDKKTREIIPQFIDILLLHIYTYICIFMQKGARLLQPRFTFSDEDGPS